MFSLSTALPTTLAAQDADANEDKEKAKIQREEEREKARQERETERVYQQAKKLADKGQWEEALKAFDEASQKVGSRVRVHFLHDVSRSGPRRSLLSPT